MLGWRLTLFCLGLCVCVCVCVYVSLVKPIGPRKRIMQAIAEYKKAISNHSSMSTGSAATGGAAGGGSEDHTGTQSLLPAVPSGALTPESSGGLRGVETPSFQMMLRGTPIVAVAAVGWGLDDWVMECERYVVFLLLSFLLLSPVDSLVV